VQHFIKILSPPIIIASTIITKKPQMQRPQVLDKAITVSSKSSEMKG